MKITFLGAAESITGSKHLVETDGVRILLDCGLHQGGHTTADKANQTLPFDAKSIDCVILSHAHADHCGMLPILVKNGFRGKIYCTTATADIAKYILKDSAMVQQQEAKYLQAHLLPDTAAAEVMYTPEESENTFQYFQPTPYFRLTHQWTQISPHVRMKFYDAGHILGSAITLLEVKEKGLVKNLAFTGDLGQPGVPILHDPELITEHVDALICEATYGGITHEPLTQAAVELKDVIVFALEHKSKIIIPAFALGRTQELVYVLHDLINKNKIAKIPIYVDSPLGLNISEVFSKHAEDFDAETWTDFTRHKQLPFTFENLHYIHTVEESKELNTKPGPFIVISSSGMMEGGRILHHLKNGIENSKNTVLITGYQAENTLGRRIQQGQNPIRILGSTLSVNARIKTMHEFSAHADQKYLASYIQATPALKNLFLVHTELPQAETLKQSLMANNPTFKITIPKLGESFKI